MKVTSTKETMNIYLLNIPFAIVGVAIAIVPLLIGMKHQTRTPSTDHTVVVGLAQPGEHPEREYDRAA